MPGFGLVCASGKRSRPCSSPSRSLSEAIVTLRWRLKPIDEGPIDSHDQPRVSSPCGTTLAEAEGIAADDVRLKMKRTTSAQVFDSATFLQTAAYSWSRSQTCGAFGSLRRCPADIHTVDAGGSQDGVLFVIDQAFAVFSLTTATRFCGAEFPRSRYLSPQAGSRKRLSMRWVSCLDQIEHGVDFPFGG